MIIWSTLASLLLCLEIFIFIAKLLTKSHISSTRFSHIGNNKNFKFFTRWHLQSFIVKSNTTKPEIIKISHIFTSPTFHVTLPRNIQKVSTKNRLGNSYIQTWYFLLWKGNATDIPSTNPRRYIFIRTVRNFSYRFSSTLSQSTAAVGLQLAQLLKKTKSVSEFKLF